MGLLPLDWSSLRPSVATDPVRRYHSLQTTREHQLISPGVLYEIRYDSMFPWTLDAPICLSIVLLFYLSSDFSGLYLFIQLADSFVPITHYPLQFAHKLFTHSLLPLF